MRRFFIYCAMAIHLNGVGSYTHPLGIALSALFFILLMAILIDGPRDK